MTEPEDEPPFSLEEIRREGLITPSGAEPAAHDGTGRVQLSFTVEDKEAPPTHRQVRVPPGVSVFDSASWNGIAIDSTCGGHGTCHKCKVRVSPATPVTRHDARTFSPGELDDGLAAGLPGPGDPRPRRRRTSPGHPPQGRHRRRRPAGHPAARGPEAVRRADRAHARGPALRPGPAARRDRRPRADPRPPRPAAAAEGAPRGGLQGDGGDRRRGPGGRRARRHHLDPLRHRLRPRHHDGRGHPARPGHRDSRSASPRCSTGSNPSAPT